MDPANTGTRFTYIAEAGSRHAFHDTLHNFESAPSAYYYTRDSSYLRLAKISGTQYQVHFPDGSKRLFVRDTNHWSSPFRPAWIEDAWGNRLTITHVSNLHWQLSDPHRSHDVYFVNRTIDGQTWKVVDRVELARFGGGQATYSFRYVPMTVDESCYDEDDTDTVNDIDGVMTPAQRSIYALADVSLPDGSKWQMPNYYTTCTAGSGTTLSDAENQPAVLKKLVLPTLGAYEWTYRDYTFPTRVILGSQGGGTFSAITSTGVRRKRMLNASGSCFSHGEVDCEWTYTPDQDWGNFEASTLVRNPAGDETRSYFDVRFRPDATTYDGWQYGLPIGRRSIDGADRWISQEIYHGTEASGAKKRSIYLRYERDKIDVNKVLPEDWELLNRRVASRKTLYHADGNRERTRDSSNFDGLGHYRSHTSNATSWSGGAARTDFTFYNPTVGSYNVNTATNGVSGGFTGPPSTWILGTYSEKSQTEGSTAKQQFCFDAGTGALLRQRVLKGSSPGSTDVVTLYNYTATGNRYLERWYGADTGSVGTGALCSTGVGTERYRRRTDHAYGGVLRSKWITATGSLVLHTYQATVDASTGLPKTVKAANDLVTTLSYDSSGRLTSEIPQTGHGARTTYTYTRATSASSPAEVLIRTHNNAGSVILTQNRVKFDPFGRPWQDLQLEPSGQWSNKVTTINSMGWKHAVTERDYGWPSQQTVFKEFDAFGRAGKIIPPDGSGHQILLWHTGDRRVRRDYKVCISTAGCSTSSSETTFSKTELYDRHGRLYQVQEPSGPTMNQVYTTYYYDVGNRLREASTSALGLTQKRLFNYDQRGFLTSERHPEKGSWGNGYVYYLTYDPLGNPGRKVDGPFDVRYNYDRAGRLTDLDEWKDSTLRPLKDFVYGTANGTNDLRKGQLWYADRYNYVTLNGNPFTVRLRETYTYAGTAGAVSRRDSQFYINGSAAEGFTQGFSWRDAGNLNYIDYPECTHGCGAITPRRVQFNFNGNHRQYLQSIQDLTTGAYYASGCSYHGNGMPATTTHGNGVVDHQTVDSSGMARPGRIYTTGANSNWDSGTYRYDGSGNITYIGTSRYAYDGVSRLTQAKVGAYQTNIGDYLTQTYSYDPFGNIQSLGGVNVPEDSHTNRLTGSTYDAAGNITNYNGTLFDYDALGMVTKRTSSGSDERLFIYTADDERLWSYHWTGSRWTIRDLDGKVLRDYRSGPSGWSVERDYVHANGRLLAARNGAGTTYHYHPDHLGTPRLITNQFGNKMAYHAYYPYGEEATYWNQDSERMKFTGHERDFYDYGDGDDLDYQHARYYDFRLGRYLSIDPIQGKRENPQSWNRYGYALGNPILYTDPTGELTGSQMADAIEGPIREIKDEMTNGLSDGTVFGLVLSTLAGASMDAPLLLTDLLRVGEASGEAVGSGASIGDLGLAFLEDSMRALGIAGVGFTVSKSVSAISTALKAKPLQGTRYTGKVRQQMRINMKDGQADFHGFPLEVDNFAGLGKTRTIRGGDGVARTRVQLQGSYKGRNGSFEWIIEPDGTVNHRLFVPRD